MEKIIIQKTNFLKKCKYILAIFMAGLGFTILGLLFSPLLIGIPIAIGGFFAVLISPIIGSMLKEVPCPYCRKINYTVSSSFQCRECKKRIVIRDQYAFLVV